MSPTSYSQALSSLTRGVALLKSIPEVPKRQVDKTAELVCWWLWKVGES